MHRHDKSPQQPSLEVLVQQMQSTPFPHHDTWPDWAAIRAGHGLYQQWADEMSGLGVSPSKPSSVLIDYLWTHVIMSSTIHPTIVLSFFDAMYSSILRNQSAEDPWDMAIATKNAGRRRTHGLSRGVAWDHSFLWHWLRQLEEMSRPEVAKTDRIRTACIRVYALQVIVHMVRTSARNFDVAPSRQRVDYWKKSDHSLYHDDWRGMHPQSRIQWTQNLLQSLFTISPTPTEVFYATLSPILLSSLWNSSEEDALVLWNGLKRRVWNAWSQWDASQQCSWVRWMLCCMDVMWWRPPSRTMWDAWWQDWTDWVVDLARRSDPASRMASLDWNSVWTVQLPRYLSMEVSSPSYHMAGADAPSIYIVNTLFPIAFPALEPKERIASITCISTLSCWRLFICSAMQTSTSTILFPCFDNDVSKGSPSKDNPLRRSICRMALTLAPVNGDDTEGSNQRQVSPEDSNATKIAPGHWLELFGLECEDHLPGDASSDFIYGWLARISEFSQTHFSTRQQMAALSFGLGLLIDGNCSCDLGFTFLTNLLKTYNHLAVHTLLFVMEKLHDMLSRMRRDDSVGRISLQYLNFLCCPQLLSNPHCASEIWNLFSHQWLPDTYNVPVTFRIVLIRLLPRLVAGNLQFYHPVLDQIAMNLTASTTTFELRLAAVASIADLAAGGYIQDASDVIVWFQSLLVPVSETKAFPQLALLVHYALMTLHHLLVAQQLDFQAVITYLNKKLGCCNFSHEFMLQTPPVVLEALVLVLGDGENSSTSDEHGFDENGRSPRSPSFVQVLLHLGRTMQQQYEDSDARRRIRGKIIQSLSKKSLRNLGVDEAVLRGVVFDTLEEKKDETDHELELQYGLLRDFLLFEMREFSPDDEHPDTCKAFYDLVSKLLVFEEATLGSNLWRDPWKSGLIDKPKNNLIPTSPKQSDLTASVGDTVIPHISVRIEDFAPSYAASIAMLLSCDGSSITVLRDHADTSLDTNNPLVFVLCLQGFLIATSRLVTAQSKPIGVLLSEISTWYEIFVSSDAMHLILSCSAIFIPMDSREPCSEKSYVEEIYDSVQEAVLSNDFERRDLAGICLGLLGYSCLRYADLDRINFIIDQIAKCRDDKVDASFGEYYGLALIANACPKFLMDDLSCQIPSNEIKGIVSRINGYLLEQLVSCFNVDGLELDLISCTKQGKVTSTLVESVLTMRPSSLSLIQSKKALAQELFLSCAISIPSLTIVNNYLLLAVFRFLESLEWGSGKGLLMPSVVQACHKSAVDSKLLQSMYQNYVLSLSIRLECFEDTELSDELADMFFALKGARWRVPLDSDRNLSSLNQKALVTGGRSQILVAYALSIASMSCFGTTSMETLTAFDENCKGDDVRDLLDILTTAVASKEKRDHADIAQILLGLLSSVRTRTELADHNLPTEDFGWKHARETARLLSDQIEPNEHDDLGSIYDIENTPRPQAQTLLAGICSVFEILRGSLAFNRRQTTSLSTALQSLCVLRTPENFTRMLIERLLGENVATEATVKYLCSQVKIHRQAFTEDPSFIAVATELCATNDQMLHEWTRSEDAQIAVLYNIIEILPALHLMDYLNNVWNSYFHSVSSKSMKLVGLFLAMIQRVLSSGAMSRKITTVAQDFVLRTLFRDIQQLPSSALLESSRQASGSILQLYAGCLQKIPFGVVDTARILRPPLGNDSFRSEFFRAILVLKLVVAGYFDDRRGLHELEAIASWITKCTLSFRNESTDEETFRRIVCIFSLATQISSMSSIKPNILTSIVDLAMLADAESGRFVLELLAVVVAFWTSECDNSGDLSLGFLCLVDMARIHEQPVQSINTFFQIAVHELPCNLAALIRTERIEISNHLIRWLALWTADGIGMNQTYIQILEHMVLRCHESEDREEYNVVVNMAAQMMQNRSNGMHA